jgi:hypothetical protein
MDRWWRPDSKLYESLAAPPLHGQPRTIPSALVTHNALTPVPSLYTGATSLSSSSCGLLSTSWFILRFAALSTPFSLRIVNPVQTRTATALDAATTHARCAMWSFS